MPFTRAAPRCFCDKSWASRASAAAEIRSPDRAARVTFLIGACFICIMARSRLVAVGRVSGYVYRRLVRPRCGVQSQVYKIGLLDVVCCYRDPSSSLSTFETHSARGRSCQTIYTSIDFRKLSFANSMEKIGLSDQHSEGSSSPAHDELAIGHTEKTHGILDEISDPDAHLSAEEKAHLVSNESVGGPNQALTMRRTSD